VNGRSLLTAAIFATAGATALALRSTAADRVRHDWRAYGGHQGTRSSTLTQINR
jgi:hypothetical protein